MYGDREACVVLGMDMKPLLWWLPEDRSAGYIPPVYEQAEDLDVLLKFILKNHHRIWGIVHTHPGSGLTCPSGIDLDCFMGVESSISPPFPSPYKRFPWLIATSDDLVVCTWCGPNPRDYATHPISSAWQERNRGWLDTLREHTNANTEPVGG